MLKGVTETIKNEIKEQKGGFLSMLLGTLGAKLSENMLAGKGIVRAGSGKGIVRVGSGKEVDFQCRLILWQTMKYRNIIKMNQDLMVLIQEIISLKK